MAELNALEAHQMARRLFLIQVLLNYRTMQGGGYLFALWPWIRKSDHRKENVRAASGFMNAHPVFASFAVGAMRRKLENPKSEIQVTPPLAPPQPEAVASEQGGEFEMWRESLAGPLGVIGDALIWDRWKPLVFASGAWLVLMFPSLTVWTIIATACVLVYNLPLYGLRVWGVKTGYALGARVLDALRDERFARRRRQLSMAGVVFAGALAGSAIHSGAQGNAARGVQFLASFTVMLFALRFRISAGTAALLAIVAALVVNQVF